MVHFTHTIDEIMGALIDQHFVDHPAPLKDALEYATLRGGKRFRARLVCAVSEAFSLQLPLSQAVYDSASLLGASIEMMHAYSLVHDDLPAMDNAQTRRGIPTIHRRYGEAQAILVGGMLQALSFGALNQLKQKDHISQALSALSQGAIQMVRGQAGEIEEQQKSHPPSMTTVTQIIADKTAALIETACLFGAIAAEDATTPAPSSSHTHQPPKTQAKNLGYHLGMMYQIADDINDHQEQCRTNITHLEGLQAAQERVLFHHKHCVDCLHRMPGHTLSLQQLVSLVASNTHTTIEPPHDNAHTPNNAHNRP